MVPDACCCTRVPRPDRQAGTVRKVRRSPPHQGLPRPFRFAAGRTRSYRRFARSRRSVRSAFLPRSPTSDAHQLAVPPTSRRPRPGPVQPTQVPAEAPADRTAEPTPLVGPDRSVPDDSCLPSLRSATFRSGGRAGFWSELVRTSRSLPRDGDPRPDCSPLGGSDPRAHRPPMRAGCISSVLGRDAPPRKPPPQRHTGDQPDTSEGFNPCS